jgi:hypothetical protein
MLEKREDLKISLIVLTFLPSQVLIFACSLRALRPVW